MRWIEVFFVAYLHLLMVNDLVLPYRTPHIKAIKTPHYMRDWIVSESLFLNRLSVCHML